MLLEFTISNYRSFGKKTSFSMIASSLSDLLSNTIPTPKHSFLKTSVIFGPNSAGKSNLFQAFATMKNIVRNSHQYQPDEPLDYEPFLYSKIHRDAPSFFQIVFLLDGKIYRYGFAFNKYEILEEYLTEKGTTKDKILFHRIEEEITPSRSFKDAKINLIEQTKKNTLFLSILSINNSPIAGSIIRWFNAFNVILGNEDTRFHQITIENLKKETHRKLILDLLKKSDLFIQDLIIEDDEIYTIHNLYDDHKNPIETIKVNLLETESRGTSKLFNLAGAIIDTLIKGKILMIDEFDTSIHTLLSHSIIEYFHDSNYNKQNAQLFITTHDTNLLDLNLFRRDQIWFIEKESDENSKLYSLLEFKPRNDISLEKRYLEGKFGGIPYIKKLGV
jgi:uncharacterized protein